MKNSLLLLAAMMLFGACAAPAAAADVRIWPSAVAQDADVRLGDVATLSGFDPAITERLSRLSLRPAPAASRNESVSLEDVRAALDGARVNLADVRIFGAAR